MIEESIYKAELVTQILTKYNTYIYSILEYIYFSNLKINKEIIN